MNKKIIALTVFPVVSGILVSSVAEIITNKKIEEEPHLIHNSGILTVERENIFISDTLSSAVVINTFEEFLGNR
jgi:hypothetical protein